MRKVTTFILLLFFLFGLSISSGCDGAKVDWSDIKSIAWTAIQEFIAQQVIIAKTNYVDNPDAVKSWVLNKLEGSKLYAEVKSKLDEHHITFNEIAIIDAIYKVINDNWRDVLNGVGIDVDGDDPIFSGLVYLIDPGDFPGIYEVEIE